MKLTFRNIKNEYTKIIGVLFYFISMVFICSNALAQQVYFNSQYYTNQFFMNPAFTGNKTYSNAFMGHRTQWTNIKGAPQMTYLTIDAPVKEKNIGLGFKAYTYTTDIISQTGLMATYSYMLKVDENNSFRFGLGMGVLDNKIDYARAVMRDKDDPFFLQQQQSKSVFNADMGVVYNWKKLEVGFAVPQLFANKVKYGTDVGYVRNYDLSRHYQSTFKYVFDVNKEKEITAYPLLMVRAVKGAPVQFDLNAVVDWKNIGWAGITYHSTYALAFSGGVRYKNFSLGYAYDIQMNSLKAYTGSASEFILGYIFSRKQTMFVDSTKNEIWAEQIQSTSAFIQPQDYDDEYWKSLNKGVDKQVIFNTIVDAVLSGKLQAYDIVTGTPLTVSKVKTSLVRMGDMPKLITKNDISKIRMNEKWLFDRKNFKLSKQITRIDLLITQLNEEGDITGNDKPLFFVKLKN